MTQSNIVPPTPCTECGRLTIGARQYRRMAPPRRYLRRRADGRCETCAKRAERAAYRKAHGLPEPRRRPAGEKRRHVRVESRERRLRTEAVPREVVLDEWRFLHDVGELDPREPLAVRYRQAAPRIGMSPDALEKALQRARRAGAEVPALEVAA